MPRYRAVTQALGRVAVVVATFLVARSGPVIAQVGADPGDRVRVHLVEPREARQVGELVALTSDTLRLETGDDVVAYPVDAVDRLELSAGRKSRLPGTLVGVVFGGVIGAYGGAGIERATSNPCYGFCGLGGAALGFVLGGAAGGVSGYLFLAGEKWEAVPLGARLGLGPGGIGFRIPL